MSLKTKLVQIESGVFGSSSVIMFDHFSKFSIINLILEESSSKRKMKMKNLKNEAIHSFELNKNSFKKVCNGGI